MRKPFEAGARPKSPRVKAQVAPDFSWESYGSSTLGFGTLW